VGKGGLSVFADAAGAIKVNLNRVADKTVFHVLRQQTGRFFDCAQTHALPLSKENLCALGFAGKLDDLRLVVQ
jgi:hypothetical protein